MNPIAVSAMPAGKVAPGVAEAAATGTAAPSSLADLFCQMLATAQAGIVATAEGAGPQDECADGECTVLDAAAAESTDAASVLAAALASSTPVSASGDVPEVTLAVAPIEPELDMATVKAVLADAVVILVPDDGEAVDVPAVPVASSVAEESAAPPMTLAMQAALARVGLGAEGTMNTRRFGDVGVPVARPVQPIDAAVEDASPAPLRDLVNPSVKGAPASADASETGDDTGDSSADAFKPMANLSSAKPSEFAATKFDVNTGLFGGAEVQAATRARPEPVMAAAQANVPQSVSVREAGDVVVRSVHFLSGRTEDVVTVRLVPQSLGELRIAVHSGERGMEVVLTAANNAARDALEHNLVGLREALGREGMNIERVSVQVFTPFDAGNQPASNQQQQQHGGASQSARHPSTAYRESSDSPPQHQDSSEQQPRRQQHAGRLNMWV